MNDFIIEKLGMELMDEEITSVESQILGWEKSITSEEFKNDDHTGSLKTIEDLRKYDEYNCLYAIDEECGGCFGQGYIIVDKGLEYVGFVRTI